MLHITLYGVRWVGGGFGVGEDHLGDDHLEWWWVPFDRPTPDLGTRQTYSVRRSKLLISDEGEPSNGWVPQFEGFCSREFLTASSAIDYEADTVIRNSLCTNLGSDVTPFTIAHRLQTILDADEIVSQIGFTCCISSDRFIQTVLDAGNVVEFCKPSELLKIEGDKLRVLVLEPYAALSSSDLCLAAKRRGVRACLKDLYAAGPSVNLLTANSVFAEGREVYQITRV